MNTRAATKQKDEKEGKAEFKSCMKLLAGAFRQDFADDVMAGYWVAFRDVEPGQMRAAFEEAIRKETSGFPPSPGRIRSYVVCERKKQQQGKPYTPPTESEWKEIREGIAELRKRITANVSSEAEATRSFVERWSGARE